MLVFCNAQQRRSTPLTLGSETQALDTTIALELTIKKMSESEVPAREADTVTMTPAMKIFILVVDSCACVLT
jgi:hypothetical protein